MTQAQDSFKRGNDYPYDCGARKTKPKNWHHKAARGIIADLTDRHTIKWGFDNIDLPVRKEIVRELVAIIRVAEQEFYS